MVFADSGVAIADACVYSFVCKACWVFAAVLQSVCAFGFRRNQIHINSSNGDCRPPCFKILGSDPPQMLVFVCMLSKMLLWLAVKTVRFKTPSGLEGQRQQRWTMLIVCREASDPNPSHTADCREVPTARVSASVFFPANSGGWPGHREVSARVQSCYFPWTILALGSAGFFRLDQPDDDSSVGKGGDQFLLGHSKSGKITYILENCLVVVTKAEHTHILWPQNFIFKYQYPAKDVH